MRQFPNHNHRDCENTLSSVAPHEHSEMGRSGSGLGCAALSSAGNTSALSCCTGICPAAGGQTSYFCSWTLAMTRFVVHPMSKSDVISLFHPPSLFFFPLPILFSHLFFYPTHSFHPTLISGSSLVKQTY